MIGKIGHFKEYEGVYTSDFLFFSMQVKTQTFAEIDDAMVYLKQPARAWKHTGGSSLSGCHRVIVVDLKSPHSKFVAKS